VAIDMKKKYKNHPSVITMSRLPGSRCEYLAKHLSDDLNIDLFDNEIVGAVAKAPM